MQVQINHLLQSGVLKIGSTIYDGSDGCTKQYRCAVVLLFLSWLSVKYKITIDRALGAPGHGKDHVDGLNAANKAYLIARMRDIMTPDVDCDAIYADRKMEPQLYQDGQHKSLAVEMQRLLDQPDRKDGVKTVGNKRRKREADEVRISERHNHVRTSEDVKHQSVFAAISPPLAVRNKEYTGIRAHYNLLTSWELGTNKAAVRLIPCACDGCVQQSREKWMSDGRKDEEQPRFKQNKECKYWKIFEGLNDWKITSVQTTNKSDPDEIDDLKEDTLETVSSREAGLIEVGGYGAVDVNDDPEYDYYLVRWDGLPYADQETGEMMCDGTYQSRRSAILVVSSGGNFGSSGKGYILCIPCSGRRHQNATNI